MNSHILQSHPKSVGTWRGTLLAVAGSACIWVCTGDALSFDLRFGLSPTSMAPQSFESPLDSKPIEETAAYQEFVRSLQRIRRYAEQGELDRARRDVETDLSVYGDVPALLHLAARIYTELNQLDAAEMYWLRLAAVARESAEVLSECGGALLFIQRYANAKDLLGQALERDPLFPRAVHHLICLYALTDSFEQSTYLLRGMAAFDLGMMARWMDEEGDALLKLLGEKWYAAVGRAILSGGEEVRSAIHQPRTDDLSSSLAGGNIREPVLESEPSSPMAAENMRTQMSHAGKFIERYQALMRDERWPEAVRVGSHPAVPRLGLTAPAFRSWIAYARFRNGEEDALEQLQSLTKSHPSSLHPRLYLIAALREAGQMDRADEEWSVARKHYPRQPVAADLAYRMREIDQALNRADLEAAAHLVGEALSEYPDHDGLLLLASRNAMLAKDYSTAERHIARLVSWDPDNVFLLNEWGGVLLRLSRYEEAGDALDPVLKQEPDRMSARFHRAIADAARGNMHAATGYLRALHIVEYGQLLAWLASEAEMWTRLMGEDAFRAFAGFALYGGYTPVALDQQSIYFDESERDWANYAQTKSQDPAEISRMLGDISIAIRDYLNAQGEGAGDAALDALTRANSLGARSPVLVVESVRLLLAGNGFLEARSRMTELIENYAEQVDLLAEYGFLLLGPARYEEATEIFRHAQDVDPDHPKTLYGLACALAETGMTSEAFLLLERIERLAPRRLARWNSSQNAYNHALRKLK